MVRDRRGQARVGPLRGQGRLQSRPKTGWPIGEAPTGGVVAACPIPRPRRLAPASGRRRSQFVAAHGWAVHAPADPIQARTRNSSPRFVAPTRPATTMCARVCCRHAPSDRSPRLHREGTGDMTRRGCAAALDAPRGVVTIQFRSAIMAARRQRRILGQSAVS